MITITQENGQHYLTKEAQAPFFLPGAVGSVIEILLPKKGSTIHLGSDFNAPLDNSKILTEVHSLYLNAGVDFVTLDTFRGFQRSEEEGKILKAAFNAATQAIKQSPRNSCDVGIAISLGPVGDTESPKLALSHKALKKEHAKNIKITKTFLDRISTNNHSPVFLLPETQPNLEEGKIIAELAQEANIPFLMSFKVNDSGNMLDGSTMADAVKTILEPNSCCLGLSVNCCTIEGAENAVFALAEMFKNDENLEGKHIFAYPNGFTFSTPKNNKEESDRIIKFSRATERLDKAKASGTGGCCGTTPDYMKASIDNLSQTSNIKNLHHLRSRYG